MCVAELTVSIQPCHHRWYHLLRPCQPDANLSTCRERVRLQGWEVRTTTCPWCDDASGSSVATPRSTHRLLGGGSTTPPFADNGRKPVLSRHSSSNSDATLATTLSRHSSSASVESERSLRHRDMNDRLAMYLTAAPHELLPSARKYYPSSPDEAVFSSDAAGGSVPSGGGGATMLAWRKTMKRGKDLLKV